MNQPFRNSKQSLLLFTILAMATISTGCKKFLEVKAPSTSVNENNVYKADQTAIAVLTQIYAGMVDGTDYGFVGKNGMSVLSGLSADELTLAGVVADQKLIAYYRNQLRTGVDESYGSDYWKSCMSRLFSCNAAIEGLNKSTSLTEAVKRQLLGEANFMRALFNFYLVNYYGDVPLVLSTRPNETRLLLRSTKEQVYKQILADLKGAQSQLSNSFLDPTLLKSSLERVRPTKWAATALLARTYLYLGKYAEAETEASAIIANKGQFSLCDSINKVFLKNSAEAIWQMQPVGFGRTIRDAITFMLPVTGPNGNNNPVYLSPQVLNVFETGDRRRQRGGWIDSVIAGGTTYFFPAKYRTTTTSGDFTEYLMIFRLAEQYLIRAEARAHFNDIGGAQADLNEIRKRAGLPNTTANDQTSLLSAILRERQAELFTELGHRWLDLKRTGKVDEVMDDVTPLKANGEAWQSYQQLYPILFSDIQMNPNLTQNPGY